ncbi:hypothetical protein [Azospirillum argentinense]|uniref:hypothetical protein n=1 Tax=Azospirillum argentinense TaxID=2970906 RepID=UPI0011853BAE|nr:hypothetical protein [Azospirillum argentinense]
MTDLDPHARLKSREWEKNDECIKYLNANKVKMQNISQGVGAINYDEYSILIELMPKNITPGKFLQDLASDINQTVNHGMFNTMNVFVRNSKKEPKIGDIYDIDILGPDNGSIMTVAISPDFGSDQASSGWFIINTVESGKYGTHPESGAREFGYETIADGIKFYTRGASRPQNVGSKIGGSIPQSMSWSAMMEGIGTSISMKGGKANMKSIKKIKF